MTQQTQTLQMQVPSITQIRHIQDNTFALIEIRPVWANRNGPFAEKKMRFFLGGGVYFIEH
jgi:hypothetical protein